MSDSKRNPNDENESNQPLLNGEYDEYQERKKTLEKEERKAELRDLERGHKQEEAAREKRNARKDQSSKPSNDKYILLQSEEAAGEKIKLSDAKLGQVEKDLATLNLIITHVSDIREIPARRTVSANRTETKLGICTWILILTALASFVTGTTLLFTQPSNRDTNTAIAILFISGLVEAILARVASIIPARQVAGALAETLHPIRSLSPEQEESLLAIIDHYPRVQPEVKITPENTTSDPSMQKLQEIKEKIEDQLNVLQRRFMFLCGSRNSDAPISRSFFGQPNFDINVVKLIFSFMEENENAVDDNQKKPSKP
jgi:hypothetical protein